MVVVFWGMIATGLVLSLALQTGVWVFTALLFVLGCGMGVGKAGTFKLITENFPRDVGAVGGLVGMLGALGGVLIPLAVAPLQAATREPRVLFMVLLGMTFIGAVWLHMGSERSERARYRKARIRPNKQNHSQLPIKNHIDWNPNPRRSLSEWLVRHARISPAQRIYSGRYCTPKAFLCVLATRGHPTASRPLALVRTSSTYLECAK
jgi:MFS family permease